ncbi:hypothetical protein [Kutzneria chonburiensis]|uniref:Uncharacterized protein n=1 Tax=Kutzneria chonburiensis TaxID=1483604 RepID=A0ABV6MMW8_9PSEU|nr:hypothetical protein [Kutzneria chonburiensis]
MTAPVVRLGLVVRGSEDEAWLAAYQRLPLNRADRMLRTMARTAADVRWLAGVDARTHRLGHYLVGDPMIVARELAAYARAGCRVVIVDADCADAVVLSSILATPERVP